MESTFSGQFSAGELHGFGVFQHGSGERYEEQFAWGLREVTVWIVFALLNVGYCSSGHGLLLDKDGHRYKGSFHQNKRHVEGRMHYRSSKQWNTFK
ncbi:MORN repeat-containing protein 1-like [Alosa alosa]|uniref:MORN repeat-containing protein 1-like n=1 Tax=Alosa alosa TaxID=278164 RepID=UPI0020151BF0|nr:MORN repeat-containing protein 1-like [Alosa alosa]